MSTVKPGVSKKICQRIPENYSRLIINHNQTKDLEDHENVTESSNRTNWLSPFVRMPMCSLCVVFVFRETADTLDPTCDQKSIRAMARSFDKLEGAMAIALTM